MFVPSAGPPSFVVLVCFPSWPVAVASSGLTNNPRLAFGGHYTPPHISVECTWSPTKLHGGSMDCTRSLHGVHVECTRICNDFSSNFPWVHVDSNWSRHGQ